MKYLSRNIVFFVAVFFSTSAWPQTAADLSGGGDGSLTLGDDSRSCDSSIEGAMRYNSSIKVVQICTDKTGSFQWTNWGD